MVDENSDPEKISPEETLFQQWLDFEESSEPNETKQDKIINYLQSTLKQDSDEDEQMFDPQTVREKVFRKGGNFICYLSFTPFGGKGHYELTKNAFKTYLKDKLTKSAINSFALASTYADLFYFEQLAYHAMSEVDNNYVLISNKGTEDIEKFISLLKNHITHLNIAISTNDICSVFFYIGMLFHSLQDLVAHQGMTSPDHAYCDKTGESPDLDKEKLILGELVSNSFVEEILLKKLTSKDGLLDKCNEVGKLTSSSFSQLQARKQEIQTQHNTHYKLFLLKQFSNFRKIADYYGVNNALTWQFLSNKKGSKALDTIKEKIFSQINS